MLKSDESSDLNRGLIAVLSTRRRSLSWFLSILKQQFSIQDTDIECTADVNEDITEEGMEEYRNMLHMECMESDNEYNSEDDYDTVDDDTEFYIFPDGNAENEDH